MMKAHAQAKVRGPARVNAQQIIFELKHKIVLALNKLADRDTHQIGVDELDKAAQNLTPEGISPFLSCILDTDSEQKSAVRKECVRLMGTMARFHEGLIVPHLPKMVACIVKRLRDPDSIVRDACVETVGVLSSKLVNHHGESDKVFVVLVKPLFQALGEQNKQVQSGSALCLARIVENTHDPPVLVLQRMLTRTVKLLKNPHFMAKPAIVELNRSIIQAGGAPTENILSTAITSIQEALKDRDWTTRKAASIALGEIGFTGGSFSKCLRGSCITSLESCRFDKVKPVRDAVLQALKYWKSLPGPSTPEPSETGSSLKENIYKGDSADLDSTTKSGHRDFNYQKVAIETTGRTPLSVRKTRQNYTGNTYCSKPDDWDVEIAVPSNCEVADFQNEESVSSSITKSLERMSTDVSSMKDVSKYFPMYDRQESSSVSNLATGNIENKFLTLSHDCFLKSELLKPIGRSQQSSGEVISYDEQIYSTKMENHRNSVSSATEPEPTSQTTHECISYDEQIYSTKMQNHRNSDSSATEPEPTSRTTHECCALFANEMVCIRKQLSDIETRQTNLMHQLQVSTTGIMDTLSTIQFRVASLEHVLDRLTQDTIHRERYSFSEDSKSMRQSQNVASPRFSTCTPRPFVDINNRKPAFIAKNSRSCEEKAFPRSNLRNPAGNNVDMWSSSKVKKARNFTDKDILNSSGQDTQKTGFAQMRKNDGVSSATRASAKNGCSDRNISWKHVKGLLFEGDIESAYMEAVSYGDELVLVELLSKTGPVLERLSRKTSDNLLSILASYLLEGRFFNTIITWLQQVVELSGIHGPNYLGLSTNTQEQLLSAVMEAVNQQVFSPQERRCAVQLATKLHHLWRKDTES